MKGGVVSLLQDGAVEAGADQTQTVDAHELERPRLFVGVAAKVAGDAVSLLGAGNRRLGALPELPVDG
jgi:hypothetical protein